MADLAPIVARSLFWILALTILVAPRRWAVLAFLVVVQVDVSGPGWASPTAVGLENAIKIIGLPLLLLLRVGLPAVPHYRSLAFKLWILFTAYVAIAGIWSPYPLSAAKMVVYLTSYAIVFLLFAEAWRQGLLDTKQIVLAVWLSLLLATVQTYVLGNSFGSPPKLIVEQARFTTFAPPQSYAAFLVSAAALLLFATRRSRSRVESIALAMTGIGIAIGMVLVGSRYVFVGTSMLLAIWGALTLWKRIHSSAMSRYAALRAAMIGAAAFIIVIGSVAAVAPDNRIFALRHLVSHGRLNPDAIGTFEWRLGAYHTALDQIRARPLIEDVFGSGTSSAARAVVTFNPTAFPADTIDANRAIHNEFLRTFYEWGAIGSLLFLAFWAVLIAGFARTIRSLGIRATQTFWGLLPTLMLGLLLENVLAGSGTPVGTGFALVIAFTAAATASANQRTEPNHAYSARTQLIPSTRW
jgi:hypothetical protein